ncbi:MAG: mucoidy inhibitor MuiA family protein, partial [Flavisolibacter sp.]
MQLKMTGLLLVLAICFSASAADDPLVVPSSLKSVTVYRSGAELIHNSSIQLTAGTQDLVIENISNVIDINSVQVNCPAAVTLMGVEFGTNYLVAPEVSRRIELLKDSAGRIQSDIDRVQVQITTTTDLLEVLKANRNIKGDQTGLSVAELIKLMEYYKNKSNELQLELQQAREKHKKLNEKLIGIRNQIREGESRNSRNAGQLRLQLSVATSGKYDFVISYITPNAWWTPYYDVRVDGINNPLKLIYKAKVAQTTGINWKKVQLSLSTSYPSQWGNAPILKSWFLSYINPVQVMERSLARNRIQSFDETLSGRVAGVNMEN